jgi:hypothetical protein
VVPGRAGVLERLGGAVDWIERNALAVHGLGVIAVAGLVAVARLRLRLVVGLGLRLLVRGGAVESDGQALALAALADDLVALLGVVLGPRVRRGALLGERFAVGGLRVPVRVDAHQRLARALGLGQVLGRAVGQQIGGAAHRGALPAVLGRGHSVRSDGDRLRDSVDVADVVPRRQPVGPVEIELGEAGGLFTGGAAVGIRPAVAHLAVERAALLPTAALAGEELATPVLGVRALGDGDGGGLARVDHRQSGERLGAVGVDGRPDPDTVRRLVLQGDGVLGVTGGCRSGDTVPAAVAGPSELRRGHGRHCGDDQQKSKQKRSKRPQ